MIDLAAFRVRCPECRVGLLAAANDGRGAACGHCSARYPFEQGILDLADPTNEVRSLAQTAMEWPPLSRIYESRLWRRSLFFALVTGISFEREQQLISGAANLRSTDRLLDLACGPGIYTRRLARLAPVGPTVGLDLSLPMLHYGARRLREEALTNVLLLHGDAIELPFEEASFDLVNCCGALHLFAEVERVLGEIARVIKPGGCFTAAALRRGEGRRAKRRARRAQRTFGVHALTVPQLRTTCERVGMPLFRCLHESSRWMIVSAGKPDGR